MTMPKAPLSTQSARASVRAATATAAVTASTTTSTAIIPAPAPAPVFKALAAAGLLTPFIAHGATITVTTLAETSATQCTLLDAARTISSGAAQGACAPAGSLAGPNTVNFASGLTGLISLSGLDAGVGATFTASQNLAIVGPGASALGVTCATSNAISTTAAIALIANGASTISMSGLGVRNCNAQVSAVFALSYSNTAASLTLSDMVFSGNTGLTQQQFGPYFTGAAFSAIGQGPLNVSVMRTTFENNTALGGGLGSGAMSTFTQGDVLVTDSTFSGNTGNAIVSAALLLSQSGTVRLLNSTISGNSNLIGGAAVAAYGRAVEVDHSTIVSNYSVGTTTLLPPSGLFIGVGSAGAPPARFLKRAQADQKAAILGVAKLTNSLICDNSGADAVAGSNSNVVTNFNILGTVALPAQFSGTGNQFGCAAPALSNIIGPLANNGGPTKTHALLGTPGNPAIGGGDPAFSDFSTDQRGPAYQRTVGGRTDIGAFEFGAGPGIQAAVATPVPAAGAVGLGGLSIALAALGMRRRKQMKPQ
jgi:hypothetical protein